MSRSCAAGSGRVHPGRLYALLHRIGWSVQFLSHKVTERDEAKTADGKDESGLL
ncbi:hypothetical protein STRIP9103_07282 [Streptomyces ipomoeae 91-03]|uniref:Winged helix-turn helix domain-containing protein n=1 Tax=Streptomyces ipomoeae 91-03 TaxID=698759 RepID=L1L2N8_9ACTN|nr:hypothetical protein STRIP9103_07282 [Streptomyces ipomoeae 91-03]